MWKKSKLKNFICNKTEKLELGQNSTQFDKTQNVTNFKNSNCYKTQQLKLWQNSKTQILSKQTITDNKSFVRCNLTPQQPIRCFLRQPFAILQCFLIVLICYTALTSHLINYINLKLPFSLWPLFCFPFNTVQSQQKATALHRAWVIQIFWSDHVLVDKEKLER